MCVPVKIPGQRCPQCPGDRGGRAESGGAGRPRRAGQGRGTDGQREGKFTWAAGCQTLHGGGFEGKTCQPSGRREEHGGARPPVWLP